MKIIIGYLRQFWAKDFHPLIYFVAILFLIALISINYHLDFEDKILVNYQGSGIGLVYHFLYFALPYCFCLLLYVIFLNEFKIDNRLAFKVWFLIALVATKVWFVEHYKWFEWYKDLNYQDKYLFRRISNRIVNISFYALGILTFYKFFEVDNKNLYGLKVKEFHWKPFFLLLAIMVPLLIVASFQPDFLKSYPRLHPKGVQENYWQWFAVFEPLYLLEFLTLEWFFRGFLIVGMVKLLGHRAILPMAMMYCAFHFGKPMGECIGSFFGGYILGVIAYYSRSIWGGVIVHMGIAFLMDVFAILSHHVY